VKGKLSERVAEAMAFRAGETLVALPVADREKYHEMAQAAVEFLGLDEMPKDPEDAAYEEGYDDALRDMESALHSCYPQRRAKPKAVAA
jgi:hypothetical protein